MIGGSGVNRITCVSVVSFTLSTEKVRRPCKNSAVRTVIAGYTDCCVPISDVASRRHLRSASRRHLVVLRHNLSTYGRRAFAVGGLAAWNSLSDDLRDPALSTDTDIPDV